MGGKGGRMYAMHNVLRGDTQAPRESDNGWQRYND